MNTWNKYIFEGNMEQTRQKFNKAVNKYAAFNSYKTLDLIESMPITKSRKIKTKKA